MSAAPLLHDSPIPPPTRAARSYYAELDGLRFWAFLLVFVFHDAVPGTELRNLLGSDLARVIRGNGWVGVQLFFVLSGYLITTLLLREEARYGRVDLRAFWARRILRIWPLYYLVVVLGFFVSPLLDGSFGSPGHLAMIRTHLLPYLLFLGNWSIALTGQMPPDALGVLWTVAVEEQFYLVCPLLIALVGRRWRIPVVLACMAAAVAGRHRMAASGAADIQIQFNTFMQVDTLFAGMLLALLLGPDPEDRPRLRRLMGVSQWLLLGAFLWVLLRPGLGRGTPARWAGDYALFWAAAAGLMAAAVVRGGGVRRLLAEPRVVALGRISYGLYMYHELVLKHLPSATAPIGWFPNHEAADALLRLSVTVAIAAVSYRFYERPFLARKERWSRVASRPV